MMDGSRPDSGYKFPRLTRLAQMLFLSESKGVILVSPASRRKPSSPEKMMHFARFSILFLLFASSGCASTKLSTTIPTPMPLCAPSLVHETIILWTTYWRPDQKEPDRRELAAEAGIREFAAGQPCLARAVIQRLRPQTSPRSEQELRELALKSVPDSKSTIMIVVRELGPVVVLGFPLGLKGGTEVLMEVYVRDAKGKPEVQRTNVAWEYGGPFFIRSADALHTDMSAALCAVFSGTPQRSCALSGSFSTVVHANPTHPRWFRPGEMPAGAPAP